jgi:hypothetical protein
MPPKKGENGETKRNPSNGVMKDLRLIGANLKAMERRYKDGAKLKDGSWTFPADGVLSLENAAQYIAESITNILEAVKTQAK